MKKGELPKAISQRVKSKKALRESEEMFKTIFNESPIGIELYDADGMQINANRSSLNMFGIPDVSEVQEFNLFDGTSLDAEKKEKLRKGEAITYQVIFDFEKVKKLQQYKTCKTGIAYLDYIITPLLDVEKKTINGYLLQVQDITEHKRVEEEILMLAHALKSVNECVSITNIEDVVLFVNESFLKTYGYRENELTGKNIEVIRSPNNLPELVNEILPATIAGGWKGELMNKRKNGDEFPVSLSTTIIKDKNGTSIGLIGVATDITEQKRKEKELILAKEKAEESDHLKSAFLANMSHEIRTPMNGILGFSELLKGSMLSGKEHQNYIDIIEKSGNRMLNIINDIINISKVESGQMEIFISDTNINEQIQDIYTFFLPEVEQKGIRFFYKNNLSSKRSIIKTDQEKIYAILTNLVKNAIKFTSEGFIEFGYEKKGNIIEFFVKDSGIGISTDKKEIIFERFRQGNESLYKGYEGSGLGLTISKAYAEMLGGKVWVESTLGEGSVFYFAIPYNTEVGEKNIVENTVATTQNNKPINDLKILVIEDEESASLYLKVILKKFGKEILYANNGIEAVEFCRNNPDIHLILMDIKMPKMNGIEATKQIRQFNKEVIIIAQTAYALSGDKEKALDAGCNDYITKPINRELLFELIKKYF